ncbi:hypothetical protein ACFVIM_15820 [Streptomyces sp. NPDC057638]|uniref:hypothetical protein n=1 Tax=Streptomyces sp. NPDC057638 TaxID=3346190 RepID=UPI0036C56CBD
MERGTPVENRITRQFLDDARGEDRAADTTDPAFDRTHAWLGRPVFNRPAFLTAPEVRSLDHDLGVLLRVLTTLPQRLYGGDPARMARALGLPEAQAAAIARCTEPGKPVPEPVPVGRADLLREDGRFRLVEFNTGSSLGGCEIAEMSRAMGTHKPLAAFAEEHGLGFADPVAAMMASMDAVRAPSGLPVAVVTWPARPGAEPDFTHLRLFLHQLGGLGIDAFPCHIGQLRYEGGALTAAGRRVDRLFRTFQVGRLTGEPESDALAAPLLDAVADGAAALFAPLATDIYGGKDCLGLLSDEAHRDAFDAGEREVIDRLLPWTRPLRAGRATREGRAVDLLDHVRAERERLVVKPSTGCAGQGVTAGWELTPAEWERRIAEALTTPHVIQERVRADSERFLADPATTDPATIDPATTGPGADPAPAAAPGPAPVPRSLVPALLSWGVFHTVHGFSGAFVKGIPGAAQDIRRLGDGSHVGCVYHESPSEA